MLVIMIFYRTTAFLVFGVAVHAYLQMRKRGSIHKFIYFMLAMTICNIAAMWASGYIQYMTMFLIFMLSLGVFVSLYSSMRKINKDIRINEQKSKYLDDRILQLINEYMRWTQGELTNEEMEKYLLYLEQEHNQFMSSL